jgi:hypothetical protein
VVDANGDGSSVDWSIRDCFFDGGSRVAETEIEQAAIWVGPCQRFTVSGCEFVGWRGKGFQAINGATGKTAREFTIRDNYFHDFGHGQAVAAENVTDAAVTGNRVFRNLSAPSGGAEAIAVGYTLATRTQICGNRIVGWGPISSSAQLVDSTISGNTIQLPAAATSPAINPYAASGLTITNNVVDASLCASASAAGVGIINGQCSNVTIVGNAVRRGVGGAITCQTSGPHHQNVVVSGNTMTGTGAGGSEFTMRLTAVDRLTLTGNTIDMPSGSNGNAIDVVTGMRATVTGNNVRGGQVSIDAGEGVVTGNTFDNGRTALILWGNTVASGNLLSAPNANGQAGVLELHGAANVVTGNRIDGPGSVCWIVEKAGTDRNVVASNVFTGGPGVNVRVGSASLWGPSAGVV